MWKGQWKRRVESKGYEAETLIPGYVMEVEQRVECVRRWSAVVRDALDPLWVVMWMRRQGG